MYAPPPESHGSNTPLPDSTPLRFTASAELLVRVPAAGCSGIDELLRLRGGRKRRRTGEFKCRVDLARQVVDQPRLDAGIERAGLRQPAPQHGERDRKSTRLNSSH